MATTPFNPTGALLGATETQVYTAPTGFNSLVTVRFNNMDTVPRTLNAWVYSGAGPGTDAMLICPKNISIEAGGQLKLGPYYLPAGYKITATSDVADKINAMPTGIENS